MSHSVSFDEMFEEAANNQRDDHEAWVESGGLERSKAKAERERQALVRQGIIDEDGNSLVIEDEEDEEEEEEDSE